MRFLQYDKRKINFFFVLVFSALIFFKINFRPYIKSNKYYIIFVERLFIQDKIVFIQKKKKKI